MSDDYSYNGKMIVKLLKRIGWSQADLVRATEEPIENKRSPSTISKMINNEILPQPSTIRIVIKLLSDKLKWSEKRIEKYIVYNIISDDDLKKNSISTKHQKEEGKNPQPITSQKFYYRDFFNNTNESKTSSINNILIEIEDKYNYKQVIVGQESIKFTNYRVFVSTKNENSLNSLISLISLIRSPIERRLNLYQDDTKRWVKVFFNNNLIIGKLKFIEQVSNEEFILCIEKRENIKSSIFMDHNKLHEIKEILNILLFNKIKSNESPIENVLKETLFPSFQFIHEMQKKPLYAIPVCPIPELYNDLYKKKNNWSDFCLKAKARIVEAIEVLGFIDMIESFEFIQKNEDKIEVKFSALLNIDENNLFHMKIDIADECDLSLNNSIAYHEYMRKEK